MKISLSDSIPTGKAPEQAGTASIFIGSQATSGKTAASKSILHTTGPTPLNSACIVDEGPFSPSLNLDHLSPRARESAASSVFDKGKAKNYLCTYQIFI